MLLKLKALINNQLIESSNHETVTIIGANTLKPIAEVPALSCSDIDLAFSSAYNSKKAWANTLLLNRIKIVATFRDLLLQAQDGLSELMVHEIGKAHKDAKIEIMRTIDYINYSIEEVKRLYPEAYQGEAFGIKNKLGIFTRIPVGVVLAISPFNYPVNLSMSKIVPALLAGNTVVFKPATNGSAVGCFLAKLFFKAQFPAGTINVVTGRGRDIGDYLITHKNINLISFTGSVAIGNNIKKLSNGVDLILELGGKDPILVLPDADIDKTAQAIVEGGLSFSGQRCTAIKLILVHDSIADVLIKHLKTKIEKLSVGEGFDNAFITPLITSEASDFVQLLINDALQKGAKLVTGNKRVGNLFYPTLIDNVTTKMKLATEEPFGPVLPVIRFHNETELVKLANNSNFGLQAAIFTSNINTALHLADQLEVGTVNINSKTQRGPDSFPFLGVKDSGKGVQGIRETFLSMTRFKGVVINY